MKVPIKKNWTAAARLFSGRPNPEWVLTPAQQEKWMHLWEQAPATSNEATAPAVLAYTGCTLQKDEHSHWLLYNGYVSFYDIEKKIFRKDERNQMESFLLDTAPPDVQDILRSAKLR